MFSTIGRPAQLLNDRGLMRMMGTVYAARAATLDYPSAEAVLARSPTDVFSASQYLLGLDYFTERILATVGSGGRLLDVGCGAGNWSIAAAAVFDRVVGIERNEQRVTLAKALAEINGTSNVEFCCGSLDQAEISAGTMDACLCVNAITFTANSFDDDFGSMRRWCRAGAKLYLTAHDWGFGTELAHQAIETRSIRRALNLSRIILRNTASWLGARRSPASFASSSSIVSSAERNGWKTIQFGKEGDVMEGLQPPMFSRNFRGGPLMKEYLFLAV